MSGILDVDESSTFGVPLRFLLDCVHDQLSSLQKAAPHSMVKLKHDAVRRSKRRLEVVPSKTQASLGLSSHVLDRSRKYRGGGESNPCSLLFPL